MATLAQLKSKVSDILSDSQYRTFSVVKYLNAGVTDIAGGLPSAFGSFLTPPLPDLFSTDTVSTSTVEAYVSMPATFQRDLVFAANEDGVEIDISNSWIDFASTEPLLDRSGRIYEVIEQGDYLYYQGIPTSSEDITVHFYRLPVDMAAKDDTPDGIPAGFQERLLVNYAVYKTFETIGPPEKAVYYENIFKKAMHDLEISLPFDTKPLFLA